MVYQKVLIYILILVFLLRLPSLFEPCWYGDEGIYLVMGQALKKGLVWYREIHDNKPPLLYLLASIAGNVFWFRAILLFWMLVSVYLFYHLAKKIFLENERIVVLSTLFFAILTSIPLFEGNIANAEIFMIGPIIAAMLLIYRKNYFFAGLLFSVAALFKVPAAFDFLAVLVFLLFFLNRKNWSLVIGHWSLLIFGFLFPIFITLAYYWSKGVLFDYFNAAFLQNIGYLSSWRLGKQGASLLQSSLVQRGMILAVFGAVIYLLRKRLGKKLSFLTIWFLFSLFATLLSERPYPHYLIQVIPSISLLLPFLSFGKIIGKLSIFLVVLIFAFCLFHFDFYFYPVFPYYQNFFSWISGRKAREEYFANFDPRVPQTYKIADYLVSHTNSREGIFIWGDEPCIYALSRRLPPTRYMVTYHIVDFDGYQETMEVLEEKKPPFIVKMKGEKRRFPALEGFLKGYYLKVKTIEDGEIYKINKR